MALATLTRSVICGAVGFAVVVSACGGESASDGSVSDSPSSFERVVVDTTELSVQPSTLVDASLPTPETQVPPPEPTAAPSAAPSTIDVNSVAEFPLGTTATYDDNSTVVVLAYTQPVSDPNSILGPPAGFEFAVATVRICAGDQETKFLDLGSWEAVGATGETFQQSMRATPLGTGLAMLPIQPGVCVEGDVGFEVPVGQPPVFVLWRDPAWEPAKWRLG